MDDFDIERFFERIEKHKDDLNDVMSKLRTDPCMDIPKIGDIVIVAAGPLGRGHNWVRLEAEVLHVANNSYKIRLFDRPKFIYPDGYEDIWIDPVLVLDVISQEKVSTDESHT